MKAIKTILFILFLSIMTMIAFGAETNPAEINWLLIIFGCLFSISEVLASINVISSNSIFQIIKTIISGIYSAVKPKR